MRDDTDTVKKIFALASVKKEVDIEVISAAFHAIYYATLHKGEIDAGQYDYAIYDATNMSRGGLYNHFSSTREIFEAIPEKLNQKEEWKPING